jgi:collagenase-like PrtC family protease
MRFSVPTNWDDRLIEEIPLDLIGEFYGKLHTDYIGGGRSSYSCPPVSRRTAARHIAKIRSAGKHFNYLLNSACLANEEFTSRWQKQFESLTAWLYDNGVDTFTVSVPYLLELLKIRLPRARVCVSAFANINSAHKASFWERLGADEITLSPPEMNRNFKALRAVRSAVRCGLKLIVNNNCLLSCPLHIYHSNITAHASRLRENTCGYTIDYCRLNCRYLRLADPSNYLKADWIRPEDLHIYEEAGIDTFKLVDRILSTPAILKISSAYFSGRHDGNLLDLFPRTRDIYVQQKNTLPHYFRYFFRPHLVNPFRLVKIRELMKEIEQAKRYIISLKLQMGDLYSQLKDRESMINDLQAEINNLKGQLEGSINEPPSVA